MATNNYFIIIQCSAAVIEGLYFSTCQWQILMLMRLEYVKLQDGSFSGKATLVWQVILGVIVNEAPVSDCVSHGSVLDNVPL